VIKGLRALPSTLTPSSYLLAHPTLLESHQDSSKPPPNLVVAIKNNQLTTIAPIIVSAWFW
jgi:hypothetical protein